MIPGLGALSEVLEFGFIFVGNKNIIVTKYVCMYIYIHTHRQVGIRIYTYILYVFTWILPLRTFILVIPGGELRHFVFFLLICIL